MAATNGSATPRKATARTASARKPKPAANVVTLDFDFAPIKTYDTELFGKTWRLIRPNVAEADGVMSALTSTTDTDNDDFDAGAIVDAMMFDVLGFVHPDERQDFRLTLREQAKGKSFGKEDFDRLATMMGERVNGDLP
jgi:hypothetical protein